MRKLKSNSTSETLGEQACQELRTAIMSGEFRPGEKITIRALAQALNISITPAREALVNLAAEGALEMTDNRTACIPQLDSAGVIELKKIRTSLEGLAAREASPNIRKNDLNRLLRIHSDLAKANEERDFKAVIRLNYEFHFTIYERANMPNLVKLIEICWVQIGSYLRRIYPRFADTDGIVHHEAILLALQEQSPEKLARSIVEDIEFSLNSLLESMPRGSHDSESLSSRLGRL